MTSDLYSLSERECEVLRLLVRGHDAKSIAATLGITVHTVNERLRDARRKLGVSSSREAARQLLTRENEGELPKNFVNKKIGVVTEAGRSASTDQSVSRASGAYRSLILFVIGGVMLVTIIGANYSAISGGPLRGGGARGPRVAFPTSAFIRDQDFPASEIPRGGKVGYRIQLNESGRVTHCAVHQSSQVATLDRTTCRAITRAGPFEAATDRSGRPRRSEYSGTVDWQVISMRTYSTPATAKASAAK